MLSTNFGCQLRPIRINTSLLLFVYIILFSFSLSLSSASPGSWKQRLLHLCVLGRETNQITACDCFVRAGRLLAGKTCLTYDVHSENMT